MADHSHFKPLDNLVVVGRITAVHGVRGWLKIHSYTEPESNIFEYPPWRVQLATGWRELVVDEYRAVAKGFIAHIHGLDDRDLARAFCQRDIYASPTQFPALVEGEFYWHQLTGLQVYSQWAGTEYYLGRVSGLQETGANDILVVEAAPGSIDALERLIPYVDPVIVDIDLREGRLDVIWDPEFDR